MSTKIEWTARPGTKGETWNPVTGCTPISMGCQHCYAKAMAKRLQAMGQPKYRDRFRVTCHPDELVRPIRWRRPRTVFVCSMADLFHDDVPKAFLLQVFNTMALSPRHTFILLTKRPGRMSKFTNLYAEARKLKDPYFRPLPSNIWAGVTIEHPDYLWRLDHLRRVPAVVRFVSFEPLLGMLDDWRASRIRCSLDGIDWAIVGAETGPRKRTMSDGAAGLILGAAKSSGNARFFKRGNDGSRLFYGQRYEEWPDDTP